jgi:hypothetical protein
MATHTGLNKLGAELAISGGQIFGQDSRFADAGHEVCVPRPARHNVHVYVVGYSGAGGAAEIHPHIETLWMVNLTQRRLTALGQVHHLVGVFFAGRIELADVRVGRDHHVAADVGIKIEDDEIARTAVEHEMFFVIRSVLLRFAENAAVTFGHIGSGRGDVFVPPGAPESFHQPGPILSVEAKRVC